jgi:hypothetical protein
VNERAYVIYLLHFCEVRDVPAQLELEVVPILTGQQHLRVAHRAAGVNAKALASY